MTTTKTRSVRPPTRRIYRITYRTKKGKRIQTFAKVPYSGTFALTETMTRAMTVGDIDMFRIDAATPKQIERVRPRLQRWPDALRATSKRSGITWLK